MKKIVLFLFAWLSLLSGWSQGMQPSNTDTRQYHFRRMDRSVYDYHLGKVKPLTFDSGYDKLSLREKFTYNIYNEESFTQICSMPAPVPDEEKQLFAWLPVEDMDRCWSRRQRQFFKANRDSVIKWMAESIASSSRIGLNYKRLIVELDARELIPLVISTYNKEKADRDMLTVLMLLMQSGRYAPFMELALYKDLYETQQTFRKAYVGFTRIYEQLILQNAKGFYDRFPSKDNLVLVSKGEYWVGKKDFLLNPLRKVRLDSFRIAVYETTNRQFSAFIAATGYVTDAERRHDALVFAPGLEEFEWLEDSTAYWRFPNGIGRGGIEDKMDHPVTCISYTDILAYCKWAGVRLPTLDEWEVACRAGTTTDFFFGDDDNLIGYYANIWHRSDHLKADSSDGYMYTAPVGSFAPNTWGLYDMYGNVFEFCSGQTIMEEREIAGRGGKSKPVAHARGGSWWCSAHACHFFTSYDIGRVNIHASFSNQGFRVVK